MWEFAAGCMRTYLILREKARGFDADPEVREILAEVAAPEASARLQYSKENAEALRELSIDVPTLAAQGKQHERLDQILIEHLMGVRSRG